MATIVCVSLSDHPDYNFTPTKTISMMLMFLIYCSLLINIYGSCEMFVSEYRNLLADRLLQMCSYNISKEVHSVCALLLQLFSALK